jgi:hypothetical protein
VTAFFKEGLRRALKRAYESLRSSPLEDREAILRVLGSALHEAEHAGYKEMTPEEITQVESVKREMPPFSETSIAFLRGCLDGTFLFDRDFDGWFRLAVEPPNDSHPKKN